MVAPIVAAEAGKRGLEAGKALAGDIYTRRWTSEKGKGKKKRVVEHELKVNALSAALVTVGAATTAAVGMFALWVAQRKLTVTKGKDIDIKWFYKDRRVTVYAGSTPIKTFTSDGFPTTSQVLTGRQTQAGYVYVSQVRTWAADGGTWTIWRYHTDDKSTISTSERKGFGIDIGL